MTDNLHVLIAQQAEQRLRKCLSDATAWHMRLAAALPGDVSAEVVRLIGSLDSTGTKGLEAAAHGDAFASMRAAVECEALIADLSTVLHAVRTPQGIAQWRVERAEARAAEKRRDEEERRLHLEAQELERVRQERLRLVHEERRKVVAFFRARAGGKELELPDEEQADVVGYDSGHLLVTARAGAGKTRALTYRAVYLAEARGVDPADILLLAFNRKAASEIESRLESMGGRVPHVMTFHALAKAMVNVKGDILTDDEDDQGFSRLREYLAGLTGELERAEPFFGVQLRQVMLALARQTPDLQDGAVITIDGAWVETAEDKLLWDFLFEHGYQPKRAWGGGAAVARERPVLTIEIGDRTVSFSLGSTTGSDLVDRAPGSVGYIQLTRGSQREARDAVHARWRADLQRLGLAASPLTEEQLWQRVQSSLRREFIGAATRYVMRMRNQGLDADERRRLVADHRPTDPVERMFLVLAEQIYGRYAALIADDRIIDFQELILRAARRVREGRTSWSRDKRSGDIRRLRHLMIDEFQDVSPLFMRLVGAIRGANPGIAVMGVGDDWQAINGFAGATTAFFTDFKQYFSDAEQLELRTNYRSGERIVAAGNSVMADRGVPARAGRSDEGNVHVADVSKFLPIEGELNGGPRRMVALRRLAQHHLKEGRSVALLSRTRQPAGFGSKWVEEFKRDLHPQAELLVTGSTVHQYKGKQADVVIVVDAGGQAFPIIGRNWSLFRVFGDTIDSLIEAERRLFYVAVTRAAEVLVLVTDVSLDNGGLTDLIGDAKADLEKLNWDEYPPSGLATRAVCRIEVANMAAGWQEHGGTMPIKDMLKQHGYTYVKEPSPRWVRASVVPEAGGLGAMWPTVMMESWVRSADRVLVSFSEGGREQVLVTIVAGNFMRVGGAL